MAFESMICVIPSRQWALGPGWDCTFLESSWGIAM